MRYFKNPEGQIYAYDDDCSANILSANIQKWGLVQISESDYQAAIQPTANELAAQIRSQRNTLIAQTDYLVMPDYPLTAEQLSTVKAYRQALRDITAQETFPQSVIFPVLNI